jgi:hypothetical protein
VDATRRFTVEKTKYYVLSQERPQDGQEFPIMVELVRTDKRTAQEDVKILQEIAGKRVWMEERHE